ncbi:MAG TPA: hypothetical protein VE177_08300, partial [Candidatus Binatus sp.]|nr:hypothetical protein [Candidatus Binatus sp.]
MLKPVEMRKITVLVTKGQLTNFLTYAGQEGLLHVVTISQKQAPSGTSPFETDAIIGRTAAIRNRLTLIGSALTKEARQPNQDSIVSKFYSESIEGLADYLDKETLSLEQEVKKFEYQQETLQTELDRYTQLSRLLSGLGRLGIRLDTVGGEGFTAILVGE